MDQMWQGSHQFLIGVRLSKWFKYFISFQERLLPLFSSILTAPPYKIGSVISLNTPLVSFAGTVSTCVLSCVTTEGPVVHPQPPVGTGRVVRSGLGPGPAGTAEVESQTDGIEPDRRKGNRLSVVSSCKSGKGASFSTVCFDCKKDTVLVCCSWVGWGCALALEEASSVAPVVLDMISPFSSE